MRRRNCLAAGLAVLALVLAAVPAQAQEQMYERVVVQRSSTNRTIKPVVMGRHYAVSSMMPQATLAAQRILESGGNAFDAIVGGQAVLGLVQPAANGMGSDAQLLVYDAKEKKTWSINSEGTAPQQATIEWFVANSAGKIPVDEG